MIDIYLDVEGQSLTMRNPFQRIVKGTKNLLRLNLSFSAEWRGMITAVVFDDDTVVCLDADSSVLVPNEFTDARAIMFYVIGKRGNELCTTNRIKIRQGD